MTKSKKVRRLPDFDAAPYLESEEAVAAYLMDILVSGDPALFAGALGDIARARGMTEIAKAPGIATEALYQALRSDTQPRFDTINRVCAALGVRLVVQPMTEKGDTPIKPAPLPSENAMSPDETDCLLRSSANKRRLTASVIQLEDGQNPYTPDYLYKQAQQLPQEDLAALAWALVDSLNGDGLADEDEITKSWVAESHRRSEELKRGAAIALPLDDIKALFPRPHPNPEQIDSENPELTAEWFASARPASEVLPGLFGEAAAAAMLEPRPAQLSRVVIEVDGLLLSEAMRWTGAQSHSGVVAMGLRTLVRWGQQQELRRWRGKLPTGHDLPPQGEAAPSVSEIRHLQTLEGMADVDAGRGISHHEAKAGLSPLRSTSLPQDLAAT
jgi:probable addiction module antidote protein